MPARRRAAPGSSVQCTVMQCTADAVYLHCITWTWCSSCHGHPPTRGSPRRAPQVLDSFAEDADTVFGIPEESLLEVGLPYRL